MLDQRSRRVKLHVLLLLALGAAPAALAGPAAPQRAAAAAGPDDPTGPVRDAYGIEREHVLGSNKKAPFSAPHRDGLFTKRFAALWEQDERYSTMTHEMGNLDVDPFIDGQDCPDDVFRDLVIDVVARERDRAEVRARFTNFRPCDVRFDVVLEDGRWKIDDIRGRGWSVSKALAEPHWCAEGWTGPCKK